MHSPRRHITAVGINEYYLYTGNTAVVYASAAGKLFTAHINKYCSIRSDVKFQISNIENMKYVDTIYK